MTSLLTAALIGLFALSGSAAPFASAQSTPQPEATTYSVSLTAYNAVAGQTDSTPDITGSGAYSNPEIIAARSQDLADELPYGTVIELDTATSSPGCGLSVVGDSIGYRVIADSMNARMHNKLDILFAHEKSARTLGVCHGVTVKVVGHVDIKHMPKSQAELAAQFAPIEKASAQPLAIFK